MYIYDAGGGGQFELGFDGFFGEGGGGDGGGSEGGLWVHGVLQDGQPPHLIALLGSIGTELSWSFLGPFNPLVGAATKNITRSIATSDDILYNFVITEL